VIKLEKRGLQQIVKDFKRKATHAEIFSNLSKSDGEQKSLDLWISPQAGEKRGLKIPVDSGD
jgi:hypothetical protein